ncbi:uncharacterized protein LOC125371694 [Haliotis rufescens]|uniref:uncharacterized protein LOC125371694 n=1 Tax=Haliotis rufescens TaxID=6454 RepID=UPI00201F7002|nr:uncharacterized protein LOC125371694 [Haliotis rufescens]XP_048250409.1 uncharacterized protein LOC125371694 [Haliotis rufescens]XP_048250410.1 uncharacterized protein LOC125371694 [Haliotis rufescens]XP_048250411.1 uncharacterized protein LOC125371694 [Haliotis rufescens]XP_048250412.1 uncharacterized protein LOC125371694 [Haliotis rufescens]XP_048250413.1 uncharacterized protein LOC125371694 [Haliotis rufescens]XP_048250414.1 uncharacterized protein LOC125371694 [Haliotis rufescens]XP_0
MATIEVTGVDGKAKVKNSRAVGIQNSDGELPSQIGIKKMKVTGVKGNAVVVNSVATGINNGPMGSIDIGNMEVTGVKDNAEVRNSVVSGINNGQMGSIENRQQTYNIENAHGVVGGQDMRGATVEQGGITGQSSGPKTYFEGKGSRQITNQGNIGNIATGDNHSGNMAALVGGQPAAGGTRDPKALTPGELINLLRERHCTEDTIKSFETHIVDGRLFMDLDDEFLVDLEINSRIEQRKLKCLKEDLIQ